MQQREMLRDLGCRYAQGFLFAQPLVPGDLTNDYPDALGRITRPA